MSRHFGYQPSIRQKITLGYYAIGLIIIGLCVFIFVDLRFVGKKIMFGETIAEFFNTALEIRRFEKNYFLYRQESDYRENMAYITTAGDLLDHNLKGFETLAGPGEISALKEGLGKYRKLMERYAGLRGDEVTEKLYLEGGIRKTGKEIVTMAEGMAKTERRNIQTMLSKSQRTLVFSIIMLSLLGIAVCQALSLRVVRPLKLLEESMELIADGKFGEVSINSKDREIISLTNAFNKMLKELELRQRHLIQSEKLASLGTLLSGVAHELNNPLSNISSSCQILTEEIEDDDIEYKKELLGQIDGQTDRARNIVRSLLEFSRDREFTKEHLPLKGLFEETLRFIKGQVPTKVEIRTEVPDGLSVFADKQRIQQAFLNLLKNAMESISEEGVVSIRAKQHRAVEKAGGKSAEIFNYLKYHGKCTLEDDTVDIEISDTGAGIPRDVLPKIFDPFFTTKDVGKGSGLGLFIVHEIIEEHDGCIAVDSEAGKGTTFFIRLPLPKGTEHRA